MTDVSIPIAIALPAQPAPVLPLPPQPAVSPEEAAALVRRMRVEARLPRVALIGVILGLVCGTVAVWPFLDGSGYMTDVLMRGDFGVGTFIPGWLLAGLLPLLAFYAGRLHYQTGRVSTGEIETSLRKVRRIILWSMLASVTAFVFVVADQDGGNRSTALGWLQLLYLAAFIGCAVIIDDVRRGLGDFDTEHQRRRRKLARGFQVELRPQNQSAAVTPPPPPPLPAIPIDDTIPMATRVTQPLPAIPVVPAALPTADADEEHFKDLRLFITLAAISAVILYAVRVGETLAFGSRGFEKLLMLAQTTFGSAPAIGTRFDPLLALALLAAGVAVVLLLACGVLWILWGLLALNYGPGFRRTIGLLTIATLLLSLLTFIPAWLYSDVFADGSSGVERLPPLLAGRLAHAPEIIHGLFMGLLLTRPGVKRLLTRTTELDDHAG
jgi:hypothetical protein